ncbi:hypothetical protein DDQ50_01170 [Amnibacterium flavum]|uniref:Uncharacterized protein n=1 Tax=Amnibacterium flavum TaxID=2173173 RepID=A0A2V1HVU5_9MICO|nr:hypothetical protein DDQ50_01170 [Amnibacterium flavum]
MGSEGEDDGERREGDVDAFLQGRGALLARSPPVAAVRCAARAASSHRPTPLTGRSSHPRIGSPAARFVGGPVRRRIGFAAARLIGGSAHRRGQRRVRGAASAPGSPE